MELSAWDSEGQREGKPLCDAPCPVYGIVSLRASELEAGPEHDECGGGGWGDGAGKWWVKVEDAAPRSDPLIAMSLLYAPNVGVVTNMSCPALTYLGETDGSLVTTGALAPVDAAAFWALAEGQKMVLWLESGEWSEFRFTSLQEMEGNPFAFNNGSVNARFSSGRNISGDWEYTKNQAAGQGTPEVSFFGGNQASSCVAISPFCSPTTWKAGCPQAARTARGSSQGGDGSFQIQGLF